MSPWVPAGREGLVAEVDDPDVRGRLDAGLLDQAARLGGRLVVFLDAGVEVEPDPDVIVPGLDQEMTTSLFSCRYASSSLAAATIPDPPRRWAAPSPADRSRSRLRHRRMPAARERRA